MKPENINQRKYHIPGMSNIHKRKRNALFLSPANSLRHELAKAEVAYYILKKKHKFISEAVENKTGLRRDIVDITTGKIYEIETDPRRAKRFEGTDVIVIPLWKDIKIEDYIE